MTLGKSTVEKLEDIEENGERLEAVVNLTKPNMAVMLLMYRNTVRAQTSKETLWLDFIVALNSSRVLNNGTLV